MDKHSTIYQINNKILGIPKGVSRRRKYFIDQFEPIWLIYRHTLSEEEQLILNLSFGISGEAFSYSEIAKYLKFPSRKYVRRRVEEVLKKLKRAARNSRNDGFMDQRDVKN